MNIIKFLFFNVLLISSAIQAMDIASTITATVENIEKHPEYKNQFIKHALENLGTIDPELIRTLVKKYPHSADTIIEAITNQLTMVLMNRGAALTFEQEMDSLVVMLFDLLLINPQITDKILFYFESTEKKLRDMGFVPFIYYINAAQQRVFSENKTNLLQKVLLTLQSNDDLAINELLRKYRGNESIVDIVYKNSNVEAKKQLEELLRKISARKNSISFPKKIGFNHETAEFIEKTKYPLWAYELPKYQEPPYTQSEAHLYANLQLTLPFIQSLPKGIFPFFSKVHEQEMKERAKGNYVFYHAQAWYLHFNQDIYKQLWNIAKHDTIGNDFTFLRFNEPKEISDLRKGSLFMNQALFGNVGHPGSCTAYLFFNNMSITPLNISQHSFFEHFGMGKYFDTYKDDIEKLEKLHKEAQRADSGNLLQISIPADKMSYIKTIDGSGDPRISKTIDGRILHSAKEEIDLALKSPEALAGGSNLLEYALPLTTEYSLNPHHGPRIYQFNMANPAKLKEYEQKRDALFAKIKQDFEQERKSLIPENLANLPSIQS